MKYDRKLWHNDFLLTNGFEDIEGQLLEKNVPGLVQIAVNILAFRYL